MKATFLSVILLVSALALPGQSVSADFPLTAHVLSSELIRLESGNYQRLLVLISGKKYVLVRSLSNKHGFHVGDYKARLVKDKQKNAAEYDREYELRFDEGKTAKFTVIGETE